MSTVTAPAPAPSPEPRSLLLRNVGWRTYLALRDIPENYHLRMTYNEGTLEIISPSARHEGYARYLDMLIGIWTEELDVSIRGLRQMTCKREDLEKGLEPDDCYYLQNEPKIRDKTDIDFAVDPPPDLAIEVEVSRTSIPKAPIYAALGVGELWRYDGRTLRILELVDGEYQTRDGSLCIPNFPISKVEELLKEVGKLDDTKFKRRFRQWVRETFGTASEE